MAAIVASHHAAELWQRRSEGSLQIPSMGMAAMMPSYDASATTTLPPTSRAYQPAHIDLTMPLFHPTGVGTTVPYHPGVYAFDYPQVNPYNMQQFSTVNYHQPLAHAATFPIAADPNASLSHARGARQPFPTAARSPSIKAEAPSPVQPSQLYHEPTAFDDAKEMTRDADGEIVFSTDVDTLMKAIQSKTQTSSRQQPAKVLVSN